MSITNNPKEMEAFGRWKGFGSYTDRERDAFEAGYAAGKDALTDTAAERILKRLESGIEAFEKEAKKGFPKRNT